MIRVRKVTEAGEKLVGFYMNSRDESGKRIKIPLGKDLAVALQRYERTLENKSDGEVEFWRKELKELFTRTKKRAKGNAIDFTLTFDEVMAMFMDADRKCMLSGKAFTNARPERVRFRPWMPSLDRIDPFGPYSAGNCRLVCAYINVAINQFGVDQFVSVARKVAKKSRTVRGGDGKTVSQLPIDAGMIL